MTDKKICIVTNYSTTTNYGALLQAYALNKTITQMGYNPEDLYVVGNYASRGKKLFKQLTHFQFQEIANEIINHIQQYRARKHLKARKEIIDQFRFRIPHTHKYSKDKLQDLQDQYDVFICGSDQIFRPNKLTGELEGYYFLDMVENGAVKASYAASMGINSYDMQREQMEALYLSSFDKISVREANSAEYIKRITGRNDIVVSVDPVFLINRDEWIKCSKLYDIDGQYLLVYMIHGTEKLYKSIKEFAEKKNLKIITFPSMSYKLKTYEKNFADKEILDADPLHFITLILNASYFFTDSFHGTALSLILHKEAFVSKANEIAFSRIESILTLVHAESMIIPSAGRPPDLYNDKPKVDWDIVDNVILDQREKSIRYLQSVVEYKK